MEPYERNGMLWVPPLDPIDAMGCARPPWWRPLDRRRWDRGWLLSRRLYADTASRLGALISPLTV